MKSLTILIVIVNIALVFGGGSNVIPSPEDESVAPGNCPNCATGQLDPWKNTFPEYRQFNLWVKKNAPTTGNCPGNRKVRIFDGSKGNPPQANVCCCEPDGNPFVAVWPVITPNPAPQ